MVNRSLIEGTIGSEVGAYLWEWTPQAKTQAPAVNNTPAPVQPAITTQTAPQKLYPQQK